MQMEAHRISRSFARTVADDVQFNCQRLVNSDRVNGNELLAVARTFLGLMSQSTTGELIVELPSLRTYLDVDGETGGSTVDQVRAFVAFLDGGPVTRSEEADTYGRCSRRF